MARKDNDYFKIFVTLVDYSCKAANLLIEVMTDYKPEELETRMTEMHDIEHSADLEKHKMMEKLAKEFITPIEREDIMDMANQIDNVTDAIEDVLMRLYMFNITVIRKDALEVAVIIGQSCRELKKALEEFANFRKSKDLHRHIVEVNRLEEDGDKIYTEATRRLYVSEMNPVAVSAWTHVFHILEKACDSCEDVSDVIERVLMTNS
jgi:predicted phosphate transport protein (TIGR00153 family)